MAKNQIHRKASLQMLDRLIQKYQSLLLLIASLYLCSTSLLAAGKNASSAPQNPADSNTPAEKTKNKPNTNKSKTAASGASLDTTEGYSKANFFTFTRTNELYHVVASEDMEHGTIISSIDTPKKISLITFTTDNFLKPVETLDVFIIIDPAYSAAIAEVVIIKVDKHIATGKIERRAPGLKPRDFMRKWILRNDHLNQLIWQGFYHRANPLIEIGYVRSSFLTSSPNIISGSSLNAMVASNGVFANLFAPRGALSNWTNWFGFSSMYSTFPKQSILLRRVKSNSTQNTAISGTRLHNAVVIRPWLDNFFNFVSLKVGVLNKDTDIVTIDALETPPFLPGAEMSFTSQYNDYELGFGLNPFPSIYLGADYRITPSHSLSLVDSTQTELPTGNMSSTKFGFWGKISFPPFWRLQTSLKAEINFSVDKYSDITGYGFDTPTSQTFKDNGSTHIELGLSFMQ